MEVYLASPRGFCAGVVRAVDIVELALERFGPPVYVKHQIVHNPHVVADLEAKGAVTVENVDDIPEGSVVVFSAHGSPPEDYSRAPRPANWKRSTPHARWSPGCTTRPRSTPAKARTSCSWVTAATRK